MFVRSVSFLLLKPVEMLFFSWALEKYELGNGILERQTRTGPIGWIHGSCHKH